MLAIPVTKAVGLCFCLLEKRKQCRKLESLNKLLLINYLQLRIAILQLRGSSGGKHEMGVAQSLNGGAGHHWTPAGDGPANRCEICLNRPFCDLIIVMIFMCLNVFKCKCQFS